MSRCAILVLVPMMYLLSQSAYSQSISCDTQYVQYDNGEFVVLPSGYEDGADNVNIQCAFDEATKLGAPKVTLVSGEYFFQEAVTVRQYEGTFSGVSKANTLVRSTGANLFYLEASNITVKNMSLERPSTTNALLFAIRPLEEDCSKRVARTNFDRVSMKLFHEDEEGQSYDDPGIYGDNTWYIRVQAYPYCRDTQILGSLTVNRSDFQGAENGIGLYNFGGGAKVDVSYNTFLGSTALQMGAGGVNGVKLNINLFFTGNTVTQVGMHRPALSFTREDYATQAVSLFIAKNKFVRQRDETQIGNPREYTIYHAIAIHPSNWMEPLSDDNHQFSATVSDNLFDSSSWSFNDAIGQHYRSLPVLRASNLDDGIFSRNRIVCAGSVDDLVKIEGEGWSVVSNNFSECRDAPSGQSGTVSIDANQFVEALNQY